MDKYQIQNIDEKRIRLDWFKNHIPNILYLNNDSITKIKWKEPGTWNMSITYILDSKSGILCVFGDLGEAIYGWNTTISIDFLAGCDISYFNNKCNASSCGERGKTWNREIAHDYIKNYIIEKTKGEDQGDSFYMNLFSDGLVLPILKEKESEIALFYEEENCKTWQELSPLEKERFIKFADIYIDGIEKSNCRGLTKFDYRREFIEARLKFQELETEAIDACESQFEWNRWLYDNGQDFFGEDYGEFEGIGKNISIRVQSHLIGLKMIKEGLKSGKFTDAQLNIPVQQSTCPWKRIKELFIRKKLISIK